MAREPRYAPARELTPQEQQDLGLIVSHLRASAPPRQSVVGKWILIVVAVALAGGWTMLTSGLPPVIVGSVVVIGAVVALVVGLASDQSGSYRNPAERALCETPERISKVKVPVVVGATAPDPYETIVVEADVGGVVIIRVPKDATYPVVSALGRWCPTSTVEVPTWWLDRNAPPGTVAVRSRDLVPLGRVFE